MADSHDTTETITDEQIRALRQEAGEAGDTVQRVLCDVALTGEDSACDPDCLDEDGRPDYSGGGHSDEDLRRIRLALRMSAAEAWTECARVIQDARG